MEEKISLTQAATKVAVLPCATLLAAGIFSKNPWGIDGWLLLQLIVVIEVWVGMAFVKQKLTFASGASMVIAGWSGIRIVTGIIVISAVLGLIHFGMGQTEETAIESPRLDRYAMIAEVIWILWNLFGAAIVAEQESKIKEREQPVAEVKAKDRRESIKLNRVRASIESLVGETDEQRIVIDKIRRDLQNAEIALAHSHGGGIGSFDDPNAAQGDIEGYERTKELVVRLQSSAESACKATDDRDAKLELLHQCLKELLVTADERELF
jgi:hypothetical protein